MCRQVPQGFRTSRTAIPGTECGDDAIRTIARKIRGGCNEHHVRLHAKSKKNCTILRCLIGGGLGSPCKAVHRDHGVVTYQHQNGPFLAFYGDSGKERILLQRHLPRQSRTVRLNSHGPRAVVERIRLVGSKSHGTWLGVLELCSGKKYQAPLL